MFENVLINKESDKSFINYWTHAVSAKYVMT